MPEEFSVLLAVWAGDRPDFLRAAFASTVPEQERRPDQVVIVRDGPVPPDLVATITELQRESPVPVEVVRLPVNIGLGKALDRGLDACAHDVVARMDADDVSLPQRFACQLPVIEAGADLVGAALREFEHDPGEDGLVRTPPLGEAEILRRARWETPFYHPTVVFRRSRVQGVGGYSDFPIMEDYHLWSKLILDGAHVANVEEPLLAYRVGSGAYARRGGWDQLRTELALQARFRRSGFTTTSQLVRNVVLRGGYRMVPEGLRRMAYQARHALPSRSKTAS